MAFLVEGAAAAIDAMVPLAVRGGELFVRHVVPALTTAVATEVGKHALPAATHLAQEAAPVFRDVAAGVAHNTADIARTVIQRLPI